MTVADDVTLDDLILAKDDLSGADIKVDIGPNNWPLFHLYSKTNLSFLHPSKGYLRLLLNALAPSSGVFLKPPIYEFRS